MPIIRPVSDLRNKTPEIEEICIKEQKPVFITKNGNGHLVIMSQQLFEEQQALLDLEQQSTVEIIKYRCWRKIVNRQAFPKIVEA
ncbi:MAG: hypothetical protein A4E52_02083 [Pelotomaculum sp. PtaB.Bin013]|uniref:Antitoxin n=1 Tax=Pelotomaculum isophthalicicum JI TaxID=947010 RepID=A0A9X4JUY7_9FIRM|nr:type II toxin-antitoxin system Phd/YefM family antitoxin [Pelotomaculum isophthalicicum]MDF9407196.1 type II toxin-antitoxin system Phd/YefM family antitoxin [Pelotomaculum isophthalicicum JI]OPX82227.1 MAG: hypothetical protein A4E52_02083 [Pelotomaculum sp. PtaB.Bin013]